MSNIGSVQFIGYGNGTLPEVETNSLGLRVTVRPAEFGKEPYGAFAFCTTANLGSFQPGTATSPNISFINRSDVLIRIKKVIVEVAIPGLPGAGIITANMHMTRNIYSQHSTNVDGASAAITNMPLRGSKFAEFTFTALDGTNSILEPRIVTGFSGAGSLSGGTMSTDTNPIASLAVSVQNVAGFKLAPLILWDTIMGDFPIELVDGTGISIHIATSITNISPCFNILFDQLDPERN